MKRRSSLIALGATDVTSARNFYERLGWKAAADSSAIALFQADQMISGLWGRDEFAAGSGAIDNRG